MWRFGRYSERKKRKSFRRYGGILVEKSPKSSVRSHSSLINRPRSGWPLSNFGMIWIFPETRMFGLSDREEIMTLDFFVLIQYRSVTDGQTGRQTDRRTDGHSSSGYTSACIACYANTLVKMNLWPIKWPLVSDTWIEFGRVYFCLCSYSYRHFDL